MYYYPITKYLYVYYQCQSVRGDPEHFGILVISWQFEHFWANNWQGINNSHNYKIMIQWRKII